MIKLKDILLEMAKTDIHYQNILQAFNNGNAEIRDQISRAVSKTPYTLEKDLEYLGYDDITDIEKELDLNPLEEACWDGYQKKGMKKGRRGNMVPNCVRVSEAKKTGKVNPAYLTKDAAEMKKDIKARKNLKSDDPAAYGKWDADYSDEAKTKKYKTRKSAATVAYQKRFGKKEK
jgi:hypothetical protein